MPRQGADELVRLLHGPYRPPRLRRGDRASCLFKDCFGIAVRSLPR
jgi:hypothetical protein